MTANLQQPGNSPLPQKDLFMSPSLPPEVEPAKPKSKKKLFIIIGIVLIGLIGIVIISLVTKPSTNSTTNQTAPRKEVSNPDPQAQQFMSALSNGNNAQAYNMLSPSMQKKIDKKSFDEVYVETITANIKAGECKQYKATEATTLNNQQVSKVTLSCPYKSKPNNTGVVFYLTTTQPVLVDAINFEEDIL